MLHFFRFGNSAKESGGDVARISNELQPQLWGLAADAATRHSPTSKTFFLAMDIDRSRANCWFDFISRRYLNFMTGNKKRQDSQLRSQYVIIGRLLVQICTLIGCRWYPQSPAALETSLCAKDKQDICNLYKWHSLKLILFSEILSNRTLHINFIVHSYKLEKN